MQDIQKWNFTTHKYEPYTPPNGTTLVLYTTNMNDHTNCANCMKDMVFGDCYTSKQYHNTYGLGYPVCEDCYNKELAQENSR